MPFAGRLRPGWLSADLGLERRSWGGHGCTASGWAGLRAEQAVNADWRVGAVARLWLTRYDGQAGEIDPVGRSLYLSVSRRAGRGWLTLGGTLGRESAELRSQHWRSRGLNLEYAVGVDENWSGSVQLGLSDVRFDAEDAAFLVRREDATRSAGVTRSHRRLPWEGHQPVLMLDRSHNDSNIALYDRKVLMMRVGLHRLF